MKPIKAWAVQIKGDDWAIEDTRREARYMARSWRAHDGRRCRIVRVLITEVPPKARKGRTKPGHDYNHDCADCRRERREAKARKGKAK